MRATGARRAAKARKNCPNFSRLVADARENHRPIGRFVPLFDHLIGLATDAASRGNCKRAGSEIAQAKALGRRHGYERSRDDD